MKLPYDIAKEAALSFAAKEFKTEADAIDGLTHIIHRAISEAFLCDWSRKHLECRLIVDGQINLPEQHGLPKQFQQAIGMRHAEGFQEVSK